MSQCSWASRVFVVPGHGDLLEAELQKRILVLDGAMGTMVRDWPCLLYLNFHLLPNKLRVALLKQTFGFNLENFLSKISKYFFLL